MDLLCCGWAIRRHLYCAGGAEQCNLHWLALVLPTLYSVKCVHCCLGAGRNKILARWLLCAHDIPFYAGWAQLQDGMRRDLGVYGARRRCSAGRCRLPWRWQVVMAAAVPVRGSKIFTMSKIWQELLSRMHPRARVY